MSAGKEFQMDEAAKEKVWSGVIIKL